MARFDNKVVLLSGGRRPTTQFSTPLRRFLESAGG
jgi:hypothetical protein